MLDKLLHFYTLLVEYGKNHKCLDLVNTASESLSFLYTLNVLTLHFLRHLFTNVYFLPYYLRLCKDSYSSNFQIIGKETNKHYYHKLFV